MANTDVETLLVKLEGRITDFEKQMSKATAVASTASGKIEGMFTGVSGRVNKALGLIGLGLSASLITSKARQAIGELGDLADAAQAAGVSAEALQVFRFEAEQAGGSVEDADKALVKFNKAMGDLANTGKGPAVDAMKAIGINVEDAGFKALSTEGKLRIVIERLSGIKDQAQLAGLAGDIFGDKLGPHLLGVLAQGQAGLISTEQQMRELGILMSNDMVKAGDALDDKFKEMTLVLDTVFKKAVIATTQAMVDMFNIFKDISTQTDLTDLNAKLKIATEQTKGFENQLADTKKGGFFANIFGSPEDLQKAVTTGRAAIADIKTRIREVHTDKLNFVPTIPPAATTDVDTSVFDKKSQSDAAAAQKKIDDVAKSLQFETEQLGRTSQQQAIYNDLQKAGVDVNSVQGQRILELSTHFHELEDATKAFNNALLDVGGDAFDLFGEVVSGAKDAGAAIQDLIKNLLLAEAKSLFLNALVPGSQPLGPLSSLLGGLFGGGRAGGGDVRAGRLYKVGERGTEIFAPKMDGKIIPNGGGGESRHVIDLVLSPEIDGRIRSVSGPQSFGIAVRVVKESNSMSQRQQETSG